MVLCYEAYKIKIVGPSNWVFLEYLFAAETNPRRLYKRLPVYTQTSSELVYVYFTYYDDYTKLHTTSVTLSRKHLCGLESDSTGKLGKRIGIRTIKSLFALIRINVFEKLKQLFSNYFALIKEWFLWCSQIYIDGRGRVQQLFYDSLMKTLEILIHCLVDYS